MYSKQIISIQLLGSSCQFYIDFAIILFMLFIFSNLKTNIRLKIQFFCANYYVQILQTKCEMKILEEGKHKSSMQIIVLLFFFSSPRRKKKKDLVLSKLLSFVFFKTKRNLNLIFKSVKTWVMSSTAMRKEKGNVFL